MHSRNAYLQQEHAITNNKQKRGATRLSTQQKLTRAATLASTTKKETMQRANVQKNNAAVLRTTNNNGTRMKFPIEQGNVLAM